jgi:D-3-phosphoglycerate dehydrogenase
VVGRVGSLLGEAGVNIAAMDVGRTEAGGPAIMGLTVDSPIPGDTLAEIERAIGATRSRSLELSD